MELTLAGLLAGHRTGDAAIKLAVGDNTVSRWKGGVLPSPPMIPKLARLLAIPESELREIVARDGRRQRDERRARRAAIA